MTPRHSVYPPLSPTAGPSTRLLYAIREAQQSFGVVDGEPRCAPGVMTEVYDDYIAGKYVPPIGRERFAELVQHFRLAAGWHGNNLD